jgi:hypothetical protein
VQGAHFQVDPRLASVLGENYRSTEHALKELVDNAWDADAENVWITLPAAMTADPVSVRDDGCGMTEMEVRNDYLRIASDRRSRKGHLTTKKKRQVKGRKGIGKFAGLMVADQMRLETRAQEKLTSLEITHSDLLDAANRDLERINLPLTTGSAKGDPCGTTITLRDLKNQFSFPNAEKLKQLLILDYGRTDEFTIYVNEQPLTIEDISGQQFTDEVDVPSLGKVQYNFKVSDGTKPLKHSGIVIRVGGKIVGKPEYFGLEDDPEIPPKLLRKLYGEVNADGLVGSVTADWGAIIENSKAYEGLRPILFTILKSAVSDVFKREVNLARARLQREIDRRLEQLPEYRRGYAQAAVQRLLQRFYGETEERIETAVSVVLDALEHDEYWQVVQKIDAARGEHIEVLAEALESFGLLDMALVTRQAVNRRKVLDSLDQLVANSATLEKTIHAVFETNLWILSAEYSLISSNKTLAKVVEGYVSEEFKGERANKRPDLFLTERLHGNRLLIEFKRPSQKITRDHENQAIKYRDDLSRKFGTMDILLLGKERDANSSTQYASPNLKVFGYEAIISTARSQLEWLLRELRTEVAAELPS